jgi:S1-C subfamily serine protease
MRGSIIIAALGALSLVGGGLNGQSAAPSIARVLGTFDDADRPRLGISTRSSGKRDTLGLLVDGVTAGGPADKAGIEEGDRLVSVNGVNLRLSRDDAEDDAMSGVASRRLTRELGKHKAGDEVELRLYRDGQTRTVRAKIVAAEDLEPEASTVQSLRTSLRDRAVLGLSLGGSGSKRDTLGVLVVGVNDSGPAARAGIEEGDRLASINGVDLRVDREDAGDWESSNSRMRRLTRAMEKVKAGDDVELRVYAQGQTRTVHAKAAKASEVRGNGGGFFFSDGVFGSGGSTRVFTMPSMPAIPRPPMPAIRVQPRIYYNDGGFESLQIEPKLRLDVQKRAVEAIQRAREAQKRTLRYRSEFNQNEYQGQMTLPEAAPPVRAGARIAATPSARAASAAYVAGVTPVAGARFGSVMAAAAAPAAVAPVTYGRVAAGAYVGSAARSRMNTFGVRGLTLAPVESDLASYFGPGSEKGLVVVEARGPWTHLHEGDVILTVDGQAVRTSDGGTRFVVRDGERTVMEVLRGGKRIRVDIAR